MHEKKTFFITPLKLKYYKMEASITNLKNAFPGKGVNSGNDKKSKETNHEYSCSSAERVHI